VAALLAAGAAGTILFIELSRVGLVRFVTGVVLTANADPAKQVPIANAQVMVSGRTGPASGTSDASGLFRIRLPQGLWLGETMTLWVHHHNYLPVQQTQRIDNQLFVARMLLAPVPVPEGPAQGEATLSDVRVRYLTKGATVTEIGSVVRTFQVVNQGDVPCKDHSPCSPDGRWRASTGGIKLDAGEGQEFRNVRVSCIAGPCPFTRIENDGFSHGGRVITVGMLDWSDTTTFLVEAEVMHTVANDVIRQAYPAIFGRVISFTLPASAQGPSFEADLNGQEITFPLGPDLVLSWANCSLKVEADQTKLYSCELKPGYRVRL
jgi:hypothetical protein